MTGRARRDVPRLSLNQQEAAESIGVSVDHFERHVKTGLAGRLLRVSRAFIRSQVYSAGLLTTHSIMAVG